MNKIPLGSDVRDTLTGFKGVAFGYTMWMNGCNRYLIQSRDLREGKVVDLWVDEQQVELVKEEEKKVALSQVGGPQRDPSR